MENFSQQGSTSYGVRDYIVDALHVGDEFKNSRGEVMAKIVDMTVENADFSFILPSGEVVVRKNPLWKTPTLILELTTSRVQGINYFMDVYEVRVGQTIPIFLPDITISPIITKLYK